MCFQFFLKAIPELRDFTVEREFEAIQNVLWKYDVVFLIYIYIQRFIYIYIYIYIYICIYIFKDFINRKTANNSATVK